MGRYAVPLTVVRPVPTPTRQPSACVPLSCFGSLISWGRSSMDAYARRHPLSRSARRCTQARAALQASLACAYPRRPDRQPPDHRSERVCFRARVTSMGTGRQPSAAP